jgi:hypothetical protein
MTARQVRIPEWSVIAVALIGLVLFGLCGCATNPQRNAFGTFSHEAAQGIAKPDEAQMRCERIKALADACQESYGFPARAINDDSLPSVIADVQSDFTIGKIGGIGGADWIVTLLGGGGIGGTLLLLLRQYLSERGKRKNAEGAADDFKKMNETQIKLVEHLPDGLTANQVKELTYKKMVSAGLEPKFHEIVKETTET